MNSLLLVLCALPWGYSFLIPPTAPIIIGEAANAGRFAFVPNGDANLLLAPQADSPANESVPEVILVRGVEDWLPPRLALFFNRLWELFPHPFQAAYAHGVQGGISGEPVQQGPSHGAQPGPGSIHSAPTGGPWHQANHRQIPTI